MELIGMENDPDIEESGAGPSVRENHLQHSRYLGAVKQKAYIFDGDGNYYNKEWDLAPGKGKEFCWYHVELSKDYEKLTQVAQYLINILCPPLKLQDILSLVSNGPFCGYVDGALVFRVNSPRPASGKFTFRIAARVTENSIITVSLGRVARLGFSPANKSLLSEIPAVENSIHGMANGMQGFVINELLLESLLTMNHSEEVDNHVPRSVSNLVVHIIDTHVDHLQDVLTALEMELDTIEIDLDRGGFGLKKQVLDERILPKMHLDLQRLLQVIAHSEQVFPRVKEKCSLKQWFLQEDVNALDELVAQIRRLKENIGFVANRITAIQAGLDSWQAEQIHRKLYFLSFLSIIFLPLSIITGVFGMNVGGVPWTGQRNPETKEGFRNVIILGIATLVILLLCFTFPALYRRVFAWQHRKQLTRNWSISWRSFARSARLHGDRAEKAGYLRL